MQKSLTAPRSLVTTFSDLVLWTWSKWSTHLRHAGMGPHSTLCFRLFPFSCMLCSNDPPLGVCTVLFGPEVEHGARLQCFTITSRTMMVSVTRPWARAPPPPPSRFSAPAPGPPVEIPGTWHCPQVWGLPAGPAVGCCRLPPNPPCAPTSDVPFQAPSGTVPTS